MRGKCKQTIPAYGGVNSRVEHCLEQCVPFLGILETCSIVFFGFFQIMKPKWKILYPRFENENLFLREDLEDDASVSTLMGFCLKTHTFRCL